MNASDKPSDKQSACLQHLVSLRLFSLNTMKQTEYDLLKMRHARAVANIYQYAASANREAALDGWRCDWEGAMREANAEAVECEKAIVALANPMMSDARTDTAREDASRIL